MCLMLMVVNNACQITVYVHYLFLPDQRLEDPEATVMFVLVSEESEVGRIRFGCRDNTDRESWMKWMVRATGQNFDPQPSVPEYHRGKYRSKKCLSLHVNDEQLLYLTN